VGARIKAGLADFTKNLGFFLAIIPHEILNRSITRKTAQVLRDGTFAMAE
jgi:hypothetical protein